MSREFLGFSDLRQSINNLFLMVSQARDLSATEQQRADMYPLIKRKAADAIQGMVLMFLVGDIVPEQSSRATEEERLHSAIIDEEIKRETLRKIEVWLMHSGKLSKSDGGLVEHDVLALMQQARSKILGGLGL